MTSLFTTPRTAVGYAHVAVERGVDRYPEGLTYAIGEELRDLHPGERVIVPLGRGDTPTAGYVVDLIAQPARDPERIKFIDQRTDDGPALPGQLVDLARWISGYYVTPIGMTLATLLPAAVKKQVGRVTKRMIDLGDPLPLGEKLPAKQRAVLDALAALSSHQRPVEIRDLADAAGSKTIGPITRLLDRGLVEERRTTDVEAVWREHATAIFIPEAVTSAQRRIIDEMTPALTNGFSTHLLFGVTGSGKTEVYIRIIEKVLAAGRSALLLVPEISLTPQTGGRLIGRFPDHRVAVLHSGLTAAQRHQQWRLAASGGADIVIGARSAVFAPIPDGRLGLIIVDEEHDSSYKQDQAPRYHGRDVAVRRAQLAKCPVLLGSATPSLESWHNATERKTYTLHRLTDRAPGMRLPAVRIVDFMDEQRKLRKAGDRHVRLIGPILEGALRDTLAGGNCGGGGQALLLLNRRGYANYIACPDVNCGWLMTCDHCDVTVVFHRARDLPAGGFVQCHHCHTEQKLPAHCPQCGKSINTFGLGTQRVEEEIERILGDVLTAEQLYRVDSDTMRTASDFHDVLGRFGAGRIRVLLGTQMIAKGLDYPGVRLVGVINADTALNLPDFRATERTFQLVNQVAGRCGRSVDPGLAVVQTFNPHAAAIKFAAAHDYESFAARETEDRRKAGLPPITRMARIVTRSRDHIEAMSAARRVENGLRALPEAGPLRIRPAAPCPISRIADHHRFQVELLSPDAPSLQRLLAAARSREIIRSDKAMAVDVDPVALL